jgi:hypothetical protein
MRKERDHAYCCGSGFEEEGGLGEPCLSGGEVGHFRIRV